MSPLHEITKHEGYPITIDKYGNFRCEIDEDTIIDKKTIKEVTDAITRYVKRQKSFDPVLAISINEDCTAKITSQDPSSPRYFRITHYPEGKDASREKRALVSYHGREPRSHYAKQTPENLVILSDVRGLQSQIEALTVNIRNRRATYSDLILLSEFNQ